MANLKRRTSPFTPKTATFDAELLHPPPYIGGERIGGTPRRSGCVLVFPWKGFRWRWECLCWYRGHRSGGAIVMGCVCGGFSSRVKLAHGAAPGRAPTAATPAGPSPLICPPRSDAEPRFPRFFFGLGVSPREPRIQPRGNLFPGGRFDFGKQGVHVFPRAQGCS